jgi:phenylalanyl-tRNA synthetase alpha chain
MSISGISEVEAQILKILSKEKVLDITELAKLLGHNVDYIRYYIELLKNKGLIEHKKEVRTKYYAGGKLKEVGNLPEYYIYKVIDDAGGRVEIAEARKRASKRYNLSSDDITAGIGYLVKNGIIRITGLDKGRILELNRSFPDELRNVINLLMKKDGIYEEDASEYRDIITMLSDRPGFIDTVVEKREWVSITQRGIQLSKKIGEVEEKEYLSDLTPDLIRTGEWRDKVFKEYDVSLPGPPRFGGRRHPMRELLKEIREIFTSMGFVEEDGPLIELAFWNFDALFQPQDHPARDMHDTFYLKMPRYGDIGKDIPVDKVKITHESGWETGSRGWGYKWDINEARKLVLRTHTTSVTVRMVYEYGETPAKIFSIGKVFRNESIDYKHLAELHQVDGIVIDPDTNLKELLGILKTFYEKLGFKKIVFWPSYFPYTEPSVQVSVYVDELGKYLEMAGSGIFRPEVTIPLGVKWPVLAWGIGIERILMLRYGWDDIRTIYTSDIGLLRGFKKCLY